MARTAREVIKGSLRLLGVLGRGVPLSAEDAADGLEALNDMLDAWSIEELMIPSITEEDFTLVAGTAAYTIGSSQTFNTTTPIAIDEAKIVDANNNQYDVEIVTLRDWNKINDHTVQGRPYQLYYERPSGTGTINLYFTPDTAETLRLFSVKPLTNFTGLSMTHVFPNEYSLALKFNLAVFMAAEHGKTPRADVVAIADETKRNIKMQNFEPELLTVDDGLLNRNGRGYNIDAG